MNSKNSRSTPAANKIILKQSSIADFNNKAAAQGRNSKSRNCPVAEMCTPMVVSLPNNNLSWDYTFSLPLYKV